MLEAVSTLAVTTMSPGPVLPKAIERALPPEAAGESSWRLENRIVAVGEVGMGVALGDGDADGVAVGSSVGVSVGGCVAPPGRVGVGLPPATRVGVGEAPLVPPRGISTTAAPKPISRARTTARTIATRRQPSSVTSTLLLGTWGGHTEDSEPRPPARGRRRVCLGYTPIPTAKRRGLTVGAWRSLVARIVRDDEVGGSNPLAPTKLTDLAFQLIWAAAPRRSRGRSRPA